MRDSMTYVDASDLFRKDERTPAEKWLDAEMDRRGANEMGADDTRILRQIAIELAEQAGKR